MIKKVSLFLVLFCTCALFSGCVKYETTIQIDKKQKTNISFFAGFNAGAFSAIAESFGKEDTNFKEEIRAQLEEDLEKNKAENKDPFAGYNVEVKEDGNFVGYSVNQTFKNFKEITLLPYFENKQRYLVDVKDYTFKRVYSINFDVDFAKMQKTTKSNSEKASQIGNMDNPQAQEYLENAGFAPINKLTIQIPYKAKETNAHQKDDEKHIYTWDLPLSANERQTVMLTYETTNVLNIIFFVLFLIGVIYFSITTYLKNKFPTAE